MSNNSTMTTLKLLGLGVLGGLLLGGGCAGKVWMDGQSEMTEQTKAADTTKAQSAASYEALKKKRGECLNDLEVVGQNTAVLIARVEVARAVIDLDEHNLGLANQHIAEAAQVLSRGDVETVSGVRQRLETTQLVIGADAAAQRDELTALASSLDALLDE